MSSKVLGTFFGDQNFPIEWKDEKEKELHWFFDDLHCPNPISPMYADIGGWWGDTCEYMYRRFGAPFGAGWIGKIINGYVYTAVLPRESAEEAGRLGPYFGAVMPYYAENFMDWWKNRYLPEIMANDEYLDNFPYDDMDIVGLLVHLEDALDIQERHFKIHWVLNLAQFQAFMQFRGLYEQILGSIDEVNVGKILVSDNDRNWDSLKALYNMKEKIKANPQLVQMFRKNDTKAILALLTETPDGADFLKDLDDYRNEYGHKAIYTHEYIYPTWREDPTPIIEALKKYVLTDYDFSVAFDRCIKDRDQAIEEMFAQVQDEEQKVALKRSLDLALNMAPLTPDHHFYIDQGTYARMRMVFLGIGRAFVKAGILDEPDDIFYLVYDEVREIGVNPEAFDAMARVKERRQKNEEARKVFPPNWVGTVTQWSLYEEPYKSLWGYPQKFEDEMQDKLEKPADDKLKGLPASPGVAEGIARVVSTLAEFDQVQEGDILVCRMTNPAWVVVFSKIHGLVTDTGGALSHPAVVSREFGIPAVVGTTKATRVIKSGMKVRVDGNTGIVSILG
jgi:pyruvate,water dikinase